MKSQTMNRCPNCGGTLEQILWAGEKPCSCLNAQPPSPTPPETHTQKLERWLAEALRERDEARQQNREPLFSQRLLPKVIAERDEARLSLEETRMYLQNELTATRKVADELAKRAYFYQNQFSTDDEITAGAEAEARELMLALAAYNNLPK